MKGNVPSQKKQVYPIQEHLLEYLKKYNRAADLPLQYNDLLRYNTAIPLIDQEGNDTLWETVYYPEYDQKEIFQALKYIYSLLKVDGNVELLDHLTIARIDYCNFGNSKPFRIRIINRINDNYDHFYVKKADASRVYGLELEDILSPNTMIYMVSGSTLIEEHIAGVPGDDFMKRHLQESVFNKTRIAKEFVKFNERCFARLLGDMRSYNYVVDITPDIEGNQYRMRAIDFDQQSYEGRKSFYLPQYFRENNPIIFLGINNMAPESVLQYQLEERSLMAVRMKTQPNRTALFFQTMMADDIAPSEKIQQLREELIYHHKNDIFDKCFTMGQIVVSNINLLTQKYHR